MTALAADAIVIRPAVESDVALIYSSWLRSYWNATACNMGIEYQVYQVGQRARIKRLIDHVEIVCSPAVPDAIMGWRCADYSGDRSSLHYVYVRQPYRRQGIAKYLLGTWNWQATHMTSAFARCFPSIPFNPYLLEQT